MKNKILCLILVFAVVCSIFVISASAQEEYVIEAGTYRFSDTISPMPVTSLDISFTLVPIVFDIDDNGNILRSTLSFIGERIDSEANYLEYVGSHLMDDASIGSFIPAYDYSTNTWFDTLDLEAEGATVISGSPFKWGQIINVTADTVVSASVYEWFNDSVVRQDVIDTGVLSAGYYRLILPIDVNDPTWIGDRNTVWYNMRGRVITDDSIRAISFHRLGFRYFVNEGADYGSGAWGLELRVDTNTETNLEVMSITFDRNSNQFYWDYNDLVFDSFVGVALDGEFEVDTDFASVFNELFEPYVYVYTGNPWFDIVDGVVDALKIDVFGDFSPWDILITFIGISVFIWLLKLLAGG